MNNKMKLAGLILGAALTTSAAYAANGSCGAGFNYTLSYFIPIYKKNKTTTEKK